MAGRFLPTICSHGRRRLGLPRCVPLPRDAAGTQFFRTEENFKSCTVVRFSDERGAQLRGEVVTPLGVDQIDIIRERRRQSHELKHSRFRTRLFSSASAPLSPQPTSSVVGPAPDAAKAGHGELSENEFHRRADEALHWLHEKLDALGDEVDIEGFDSDLSQGVLTLRLGRHGIFVINKQAPNRQIWLSSPQSGPARFDWLPGHGWVYRRTGTELMSLLQEELRACLGDGVVPSLTLPPHI
ncbi:hypothetical protein CLOM_g20053 [Closterium sp. NIES-68]|nr:hypothetical protein CLOM_g20053 [Closterium sp. NIES-68]GJP73929.1 hypothetical protein CLOP_g4594 [Closterium sp. NIES-67]